MKLGFRGRRTTNSCVVSVLYDGEEVELLNPRTDLRNHSPTGFEWGYHGSGPAQLALAILSRFYDDDELAVKCYQQFKAQIIGGLPHEGWDLDGDAIVKWMEQYDKKGRTS